MITYLMAAAFWPSWGWSFVISGALDAEALAEAIYVKVAARGRVGGP
jgi:hypothetical protein